MTKSLPARNFEGPLFRKSIVQIRATMLGLDLGLGLGVGLAGVRVTGNNDFWNSEPSE